MELLGYSELSMIEELQIQELLSQVTIIDINSEIKSSAIKLRKTYKLKLPDLIIASSAYFLNQALLTADKQLNQIKELNILNYEK